MGKKNTQNELQNTDRPLERKPLTTVNQSSVLLGIVYAALLAGLTLLMDKIPVPSETSTLWLLVVIFYILMVGLGVLLEKLTAKKTEIKRTLYYLTAQLILLAVVIVLVVIGIRKEAKEYYPAKEMSYAVAFAFTEFALLLYHLGRKIVLRILHAAEEKNGTKQNKSKKKGKH